MTSVSASSISQLAARAAAAFAILAIFLLAALHVAQPGLGAGDSMISQYAVGEPLGWLMNLSFASFALASVCLFVALAGQVKSILGRIGLFFLLAAVFGLACGALFNMDPATTQQSEMSFSGQMHGLAFMIGVPGELLTVLLLSLALRGAAPWKGMPLLIVAAIVWISLVVMAVNLIGWMQAGANGPAYFGWPNRAFMIAYAVWAIVAAWPLAQGERAAIAA
ncbi:MAG: DUF998 domain-containing protein [Hyphomonadaceae bacterium]|nr:DUF998 domain-containing protein [Hyphomonadaceae bacterium]